MDLSRLVAADQADRRANEKLDWSKLSVLDASRRQRVLQMLEAGQIRAPTDYENAALIFQHGTTSEDFRLAYSFATMSLALEPDRPLAHWLQKATWDRLMLSLGRDQWYGTQKLRPEPNSSSPHDEAANN